jgi:hypothetical protein
MSCRSARTRRADLLGVQCRGDSFQGHAAGGHLKNPADDCGFAVFNLQSHALAIHRDIAISEAPPTRVHEAPVL